MKKTDARNATQSATQKGGKKRKTNLLKRKKKTQKHKSQSKARKKKKPTKSDTRGRKVKITEENKGGKPGEALTLFFFSLKM